MKTELLKLVAEFLEKHNFKLKDFNVEESEDDISFYIESTKI